MLAKRIELQQNIRLVCAFKVQVWGRVHLKQEMLCKHSRKNTKAIKEYKAYMIKVGQKMRAWTKKEFYMLRTFFR